MNPPHSTTADKPTLLDRIAQDVLVLDGGMGTALYERGLSFQESFDATNLDRPEWVAEVHRAFLEAGSQGIQTNTFGANRYRLAVHRREDDLRKILEAGLQIATDAAASSHYIIGSIGPLGVEIEPVGRLERAEARQAFREAAEVLADGVDAFSLETFSSVDELLEALAAVREVSDKPVMAHITVTNSGRTLRGTPAAAAAQRIDAAGADVIGINCSSGPRDVLKAALEMAEATQKPLAARPNAGLPREVEGRIFYESSPDYFVRFSRRFLQAGGRVLGGCCGTTPDHIRGMVRAARMVGAQVRQTAARPAAVSLDAQRPLEPRKLEDRSRLGKALARGECPVSIELLPPKTIDMTKVLDAAREIRDAGATLINVPDGPRASARVSNMATCLLIEQKVGIETLPHFCCRDRNLLGMQSDIMGAAALGVHNLLVVTGDPPYQGNYPNVTAVFDVDAIGLCNVIDNLNHGLDLGANEMGTQTHFCFGAAFNPTSLDLDRELRRFHWKADAGVDFFITQPIFGVDQFQRVLAELPAGHPPILAGIWPLRSRRNAEFLSQEVPGVVVPELVLERMRAADKKGRAAEEGVHIAIEAVEALSGNVQGFQIAAPFNKPEAAVRVLEAVHATVKA